MPELPEVETIKNILNTFIKGKTIKNISIYRNKNIVNDANYFVNNLIGESFINVSRIGKYLIFHLTNSKAIISHLRMEGKYFEGKVSDNVYKHDILRYEFSDGSSLRYNDVRKFGVIEFRFEDELYNRPPLSKLALDPFEISIDQFYSSLSKCYSPIKEALLKQDIISGIGNIYADEILFACKIFPLRSANTISINEANTILNEAKRILKLAISKGGSTIKSYHPKEGMDGAMQNELLVYGKSKHSCPNCSFPLKRITINGRGTTYCPRCQKANKPLIVGVSGPIASGKSSVSNFLKSKGYIHIEADKIVKNLYQNKDVINNIEKMFGFNAVKNGVLDRNYIREQISTNELLKKQLEDYVWPLTYEQIYKQINTCSPNDKIVLDVPLLIKTPLVNECDLIIYIEANSDKQIERLKKRNKDVASSLAMNNSYPRKLSKRAANIILNGNNDLSSLYEELNQITYL